jgi:Enoyl-CoA hydratase/isomerase
MHQAPSPDCHRPICITAVDKCKTTAQNEYSPVREACGLQVRLVNCAANCPPLLGPGCILRAYLGDQPEAGSRTRYKSPIPGPRPKAAELLTLYLVTLNRPKALNALSTPLFLELNDALGKLNEDKDTGAIVITGSNRAFAGIERREDFETELRPG